MTITHPASDPTPQPRRRPARRRHRHDGHQHHPHPGHRRGAEGQLRPCRRADGLGAGGLHPVAPVPALRPGRSRIGRTATASCFPTATPRCCSTPCCSWPASRRWTATASRWAGRRSASTTSSSFRAAGQRLPGHPEYGHTTGVETTTGPLGQGVGNSVGMAIAERWLAARFNKPDAKLFDYNVYAICSDGDLMEGIASEAASLAGHLKLSNLCWIYDDNHITIEGYDRARLHRGRAPSASRATAGRPTGRTTPTTARRSPAPSRRSRPPPTGRP